MHYCREKMDDLYFLGDAMTKSGKNEVLIGINAYGTLPWLGNVPCVAQFVSGCGLLSVIVFYGEFQLCGAFVFGDDDAASALDSVR